MAQNLSFKEEPLDEQNLVNIVDSLENEGLKENDELVFENENPSAKNILPVINIPEVTSNVEEKVDLENNKKELQEIKINTETLQNEIKENEKKEQENKEAKKTNEEENKEENKEDEDDEEQDEEEEEEDEDNEQDEENKEEEDESDDSDEESEDEEYNKIEQTQQSNEVLLDYHPEVKQLSYNEVKSLTKITRDFNNMIIDPLHTTIPMLTKYEKARILGVRAKQLDNGADPFISLPSNVIDSYTIAERELYAKRLPFIIRRPIPNGGSEYWCLKDLDIIDL